MASKKNVKAAQRISPKLQTLIATAGAIGYATQGAFAGGVRLARAIGPNKLALANAGVAYQAGYVARYLEDYPAFMKRVGNMDEAMRIEQGEAVLAKATPESTKANRRTDVEHKACRAAATSWSACKTRAGVVTPQTRKPRTPAAPPAKALPVDLVKASPKLANKAANNDYFGTAIAALLATVNKNAATTMPAVSSAISDCHAAIKAALNL